MIRLLRRWKAQRSLRGQLQWLEGDLMAGDWRLYDDVALLPAAPGGAPDDYQQQLLRSLGGSHAGYRMLRLRGGEQSSCDLLIPRGEWTLLMDRDRRWMLRVGTSAERARRLVDNAAWLSQSFPCPHIEQATVSAEGAHAVRESFADGVPIRDADKHHWEPVYRQLLAACTRHAEYCDGAFDLSHAMDELTRWDLPAWLQRALDTQQAGIDATLGNCPMLRAHGDCHNGNVFARADGNLLLIDLERAQSMPFFYDALSLLRGTAAVNGHLRRAYLDGAYDGPLTELWAAAGREWHPSHRVAALLAMPIAHAFRPQFSEADSAKRRDKFISACEKVREDCGLG